jgi:hypothetical protein
VYNIQTCQNLEKFEDIKGVIRSCKSKDRQFSGQKKLEAQWAEPVSLTFHSALRKLNTEPSIGASHQISVHFGKAVSEKKIFRNRPIRNKNCLWRSCLLMDRDKMNSLYREPSIDASYQVSVHLAKQFQRRIFLEIDQLETRIACGSHVC